MKKNVAGQKVGCQLIAAADGSAFTSSVTVEVTGDAGTQATGSVGSGACTHEGNGYHTYAPAQAETNYDLVAFTFHGTGAIPATVQIYTSFPQTGDNFARLGAPAGASVSADVAAVKVDTAAVKVQTDKLTFTVANQVDSNVIDWKSATAPAMTGDAFARLGAPAGASVSADIAAVEANAVAIAGYVDTEVAAIKAKTDNLPASPAAVGSAMTLTSGERNSVADAMLDRDMSTGTDSGSTSVRTPRQALRTLRNKVSISSGTLTVTKEDDSTSSWTAAVTTNPAAEPVTAIDPAGP